MVSFTPLGYLVSELSYEYSHSLNLTDDGLRPDVLLENFNKSKLIYEEIIMNAIYSVAKGFDIEESGKAEYSQYTLSIVPVVLFQNLVILLSSLFLRIAV